MRYGLVSDIHANLQAWNAVWTDIHALDIDQVICLGDIVGYGPRPAETLASVYANVHHIILGNHDAVVAGIYDPSSFNPDAKRMIEWTAAQLDKKAAQVFAEFPLDMEIEAGDFNAVFVHGTLHQPEAFNYILKEADARQTWEMTDQPIIFVGHTHVPRIDLLDENGAYHALPPDDFVMEEGCRYIVNVGSVGMSRHRDFRACYAVFDAEAREISWHRTAYDMETFKREVKERIGSTKQAERVLASFEQTKAGPVREALDFKPTVEKIKEAARKTAERRKRRLVARPSRWGWPGRGTDKSHRKPSSREAGEREPAHAREEKEKHATGRFARRTPKKPGFGKLIAGAAAGITGGAKPLLDSIGKIAAGTSGGRQRTRPRNKSGKVIWLSRKATYTPSSVDKRFSEHPDELLTVDDIEKNRGYSYAFRAGIERMPAHLVVKLPYSAVLKQVVVSFRERIPEELKIRISRDAKKWTEIFRGAGTEGLWDITVEDESRVKHVWIGLATVGEFRPYAVKILGIE